MKISVENFIELLPLVVKGIEKLKEWYKEKRKKVIEISFEDLETILNLYRFLKEVEGKSEKINEKKVKNIYKEVKKFFDTFTLGYSRERKSYVLVKKDSDIFKKHLEEFVCSEKEKTRNILFVFLLSEEGFISEEFKETPKEVEKEILETAKKLPPEYFSLINLSWHTEYLYLQGKDKEAEEIRKSIRTVYGEKGLKFSNLFQRGYLKSFLRNLKERDSITIQQYIEKFLRETEYILFNIK